MKEQIGNISRNGNSKKVSKRSARNQKHYNKNNVFTRLISRLDTAVKSISELEDMSVETESKNKNTEKGTSLVTQWLRIHLPMQGTQVRALVQEDPTCRGTTKPLCHNH